MTSPNIFIEGCYLPNNQGDIEFFNSIYTVICFKACEEGTYALTSSLPCLSCRPMCGTCNNATDCLTCLDTTLAYSITNASCLLCGEFFSHCWKCNNSYCSQCARSYTLAVSGDCVCEVEGTCLEVVGCSVSVVGSAGAEECLRCDSATFHSEPVNNECVCLVGILVNGVCTSI
jgi:hypothetical protein